MRSRNTAIDGLIDKEGRVKITDKFKMDAFAKKWPGRTIVITIDVLPDEASKLQVARYFKKILVDFQAGYKEVTGESLTLKDADLELRKMSPVCIEEIKLDEGIQFDRVKEVTELSSHELTEFMNHVEMVVARDFGIVL